MSGPGEKFSGHGEKFSRKMEDAVAALLTQRNMEEAARAAGISPATLLRWQKIPEFQAAYRDARRAAFAQAIARLQQGSTAAATTLLKLMIDPETPASVRARAAESVLSHSIKAIEIEDIEARVSALEASAGGPEPGR
jgi:hypothetical protein